MLKNNELSPAIISEGRLDAPFGKRLYDEAVIKKIKGVAKFKFWGSFLFVLVLWLLLEIAPSDRVQRFTAKPIEFATTLTQVRIEGDKIGRAHV